MKIWLQFVERRNDTDVEKKNLFPLDGENVWSPRKRGKKV